MSKKVKDIQYTVVSADGTKEKYVHRDLRAFNDEDQTFLIEMLLLLRTRLLERQGDESPELSLYKQLKAKYDGVL